MNGYAAVVLAGGAGRRLGGAHKPTLTVAGAPMVDRVLAAVATADPRVVVGPRSLAATLPPTVGLTTEEPPGGGPVAAIAAGLELIPPTVQHVALLAADLPFLTAAAVRALSIAVSTMDAALFVDAGGRWQLLCGLWRVDALRTALKTVGEPAGRSMRHLVSGLRIAELTWPHGGPPPWYDCDTKADLRRAREWSP